MRGFTSGGIKRRSVNFPGAEPRSRPESILFFFFFTLVTGPRRSLSLKLSDTRVSESQTRAHLRASLYPCRYSDAYLPR